MRSGIPPPWGPISAAWPPTCSKWYPGEQLPRWSLNAYWRRDGEPLWHNPALYADEQQDYGVDAAKAADFLTLLAERLGVDGQYCVPAYEDRFYYLWRERKLPINVTAEDPRLADPLERERLRKVFEQGLDKVVGHILPLARHAKQLGWQSGSWFLRDQHCRLIPGDSAMGYRLPLDSQPWVSEADYPYVTPEDPSQVFAPLPTAAQIKPQLRGVWPGSQNGAGKRPLLGQSAAAVVRTALCAEPREGKLYLFMPPLVRLEDYLELVAAIEATAA
jgi:uncharacterized protein (DUF2126 family)